MYLYVFICIYMHLYAFMHLCIYAFMHLCIYVFMYLCIYAFMHLYIYVFIDLNQTVVDKNNVIYGIAVSEIKYLDGFSMYIGIWTSSVAVVL